MHVERLSKEGAWQGDRAVGLENFRRGPRFVSGRGSPGGLAVWVACHPRSPQYAGDLPDAIRHESITSNMTGKDRRHRPTNRHLDDQKTWRPDGETYDDALVVAREVSRSLNSWLKMCVEYLLGLRKDFPPRPAWAERRAASLPDEPASRPDNGTKD